MLPRFNLIKRNGIRLQLLVPILLATTLALGVYEYFSVLHLRGSYTSILQTNGKLYADFVGQVSGIYVFNYDKYQVDHISEETLKNPNAVSVAFFHGGKEFSTRVSDRYKGKSGNMTDATFTFESPLMNGGNEIGKVVLVYSSDLIKQEIRNAIFSGFLGWALALCSIFTAILAVVWFVTSRLTRNIDAIMSKLSSSGVTASSASSELRISGERLGISATKATSSLRQFVASMQSLSQVIRNNTESASEAANLSQKSFQSAENGSHDLRNLIDAMSMLAHKSKQVEEIVEVIDDIAFQTNLLALNAAVEAARAGDSGRGFAVVAEAVRALAQRSAVSAKNIAGLVRENVEQSTAGAQVADRSRTVLAEILESTRTVSQLNVRIAQASQDQANSVERIQSAVSEMQDVTRVNLGDANEVALNSDVVHQQAELLKELVGELNEAIRGDLGKAA